MTDDRDSDKASIEQAIAADGASSTLRQLAGIDVPEA